MHGGFSSSACRTGYSPAQRAVALGYGLLCHTTFAAGIAAMMLGLYEGMTVCVGPFHGPPRLAANVLLLVQFPLLHSALLSQRGRRFTHRLAPLGLGPALSTTIYATFASLQVLLAFVLWSPPAEIWSQPHGGARVALAIPYGAAWLLLLKAMSDAGLAIQTGFHGWGAVVRDREPSYRPFPRRGTFRVVRQPVYVAFALTLWTGPVWTIDHLLIAVGWTAYCLLGPLFKERRYLYLYGDAFRRYQAAVPYWLPRPPSLRR